MTDALALHRGKISAVLIILLGIWGAIVPFIGPYFGYAYTPDKTWSYTSGRLWLSIVPGIAALLGGLLILLSARAAAVGGVLAALGGAWFVIGQMVIAVAVTSSSISPGSPVVSAGALFSAAKMRFLEGLGFFYGTGLLIVFFGALAAGLGAAAARAEGRYEDRVDGVLDRANEFGPAI
jgi:hypothetical protein